MRETQTDVLVVGAGPVGLWTALLLAEAGLGVSIIDREERTTSRSYACALHPHTLGLLRRAGLADAVLSQGRRIETIAFYEGATRQAEARLSRLGGEFPCVLILPQSALESVLEQRLREAGVAVHWNHRFDTFADKGDGVTVTVEELGSTAVGYIVPHWEMNVKSRSTIQARFLIGADGHNSLVRQRLGVDSQRVSGPEFFAAYEFESDTPAEDEVRVVLEPATTNVLWPLPGNKSRWTFQLLRAEMPKEFPEKERRAVRLVQKNVDEGIRQYVQKVAGQRAPWFAANVKDVTWCTEVVFEQRVAKQFGRNRCWLAGDAAHQTGPVGVQSMNLGFSEGQALAGALPKIVREGASLDLLAGYDREQQERWQRLLALRGRLEAGKEATPWVRQRAARMLSCLPASDADLASLAAQLKLEWR